MTFNDFRARRAVAVLLLGLAAALHAEPPLPAGPFEDQFGRSHKIAECRRLILFAPDREAAGIAEQALDGLDGAALERRGVCYIADISRMPGLVTQMFALPALRERAYPVLLGREAADTAMFPRQAGQVTLLPSDPASAESVTYRGDVDGARRALDRLAGEPVSL